MTPLDIEILYVAGCPNHRPMLQIISDVVRRRRLAVTIREREIRDNAEAQQIGFRGSPTLLINGRDLEPDGDHAGGCAISCRTYGGKKVPSIEDVEAALLSAVAMARS